MLSESEKSLLIQIAAEMVRGKDMPSEFVDDWHLPKTTPAKAKREIQAASATAHAQCREWSRRIMDVVRG